jgi:hypothetical protein
LNRSSVKKAGKGFSLARFFFVQKNKNAVRQNTERTISLSPLYVCRTAFFPAQSRLIAGKVTDARWRRFQMTAGDPQLRNTPLLSIARRSCKEVFR